MKLHSTAPDSVVSNVQSQTGFKIKQSAKAFSILSSGLYSNKVKAVVRELSCNAIDAIVALNNVYKAGDNTEHHALNGTQFEVHLPNSLEPFFYVRDYGIGLDHDSVTNMYTTYFESTKQDSDDFIGALGLGSKSPFSYTNNFTVTSTFSGIRRVYTAFINEEGFPDIALMSTDNVADVADRDEDGELINPNDLYNGLEVRFPVESRNDNYSFISEARGVYKWFGKYTPHVLGNSDFEHQEPVYKYKSIAPGVHMDNSGYKSYALQGNICYPINLPNQHALTRTERAVLESGLVFEFELGQLDIAASREELSYIPYTVDNILARVREVEEHVHVFVNAQLDTETKCKWKHATAITSMHNTSLFEGATCRYVQSGKSDLLQLDQHSNIQYKEELFLRDLDFFESNYNLSCRMMTLRSKFTGTIVTDKSYDVTTKTDDDGKIEYIYKYELPNPNVNKIRVVYNDTKKKSITRVKSHFRARSQNGTLVYFEHLESPDDARAAIEQMYKDNHNMPVELMPVSSLDEKVSTATRTTKVRALEKHEPRSWYASSRGYRWVTYDFDDFDDECIRYYVPLKQHNVLNRDDTVNNEFVSTQWATYKSSGLLDKLPGECKEVFGVNTKLLNTVLGKPNWINLFDALSGELSNIKRKDIHEYCYSYVVDHKCIHTALASALGADSVYRAFVESHTNKVKRISSDRRDELQHIQYACKWLKHKNLDNFKKLKETTRTEYDNMLARYPLLKVVSNSGEHVPAAHLEQYVKLIDKNGD